MSPEDRAALHALTEAVANDPRNLAAVHGLADFLEEHALMPAGEVVKRLVPETADILVGTYQNTSQKNSLEDALAEVATSLAQLGRMIVWLTVPAGIELKWLWPKHPRLAGQAARPVDLTPSLETTIQVDAQGRVIYSPEVVEVLESLEWAASLLPADGGISCCPVCGGLQYPHAITPAGHGRGCRLALMLRRS